jgi:AcrR family transcriptional regulator
MKKSIGAISGKIPAADTRKRLINSSLAIFAKHGYAGASTRMLASAAKVNLAAIPYYFGGKEGLYHAVVRLIVEFGKEKIFPEMEKIRQRLETGNPAHAELLEMLERLIGNYVDLVTNEETIHLAPIMFQEQLHPSKAFQIFYEDLLRHEHKLCTALVAGLLKIPPESKEAILHAHAIFGHVMIFLAGRALILKRLDAEKFSKEDSALIHKILKQHVRMIFNSQQ